eukprot:gene6234-12625_t
MVEYLYFSCLITYLLTDVAHESSTGTCHLVTSASNQPDGGGNHGLNLVSTETGTTPYSMALGVDYTSGVGYINAGGNAPTQPTKTRTLIKTHVALKVLCMVTLTMTSAKTITSKASLKTTPISSQPEGLKRTSSQ